MATPNTARRQKPAPKKRNGLKAALSLLGIVVFLGGGVTVALLMKKSEADQSAKKKSPVDDGKAAQVASLVNAANGKLAELRELTKRKGDVRDRLASTASEIVQKTTEAIAIDPSCAAAWYVRALSKWTTRDEKGALEDIVKAREIDAADAAVLTAHTRMRLERLIVSRRLGEAGEDPAPILADLKALSGSPAEGVPVAFCRAAVLYLEGSIAAALESCNKALDRDDSNDELQRLCGVVASAHGVPALGVKCFDKALDLRPSSVEAVLGRAFARFETRDFAGADADVNVAMKAWSSPSLRLLRGRIRAAKRDFTGAVEDFVAAGDPVSAAETHLSLHNYTEVMRLAAEDRTVRGLVVKAKAQLWQAKVDAGLALLDEAMKADPAAAAPWIARSEVRVILEKLDEALADAEKAVELAPKSSPSFCCRGEARYARKEYGDALDDFRKAKDLDPNEPRAHVGFARVLNARDERDSALFAIDQAVKLDPANADFLVVRARFRLDKFDLAKAEEDLKRALELDPNNPDAYRERAFVRLMRGDKDSWQEDFKKALELRPIDKSSLEKVLKPKEPKE